MKVPCSLQRTVEEGPWAVTVLIVSATAIRLLARQLFRPGMHISVELPDVQGHAKANLLKVTSGKERVGTPDWIVEGLFIKKLAPEVADAARAKIAPAGLRALCRLVRVLEAGPWLVTVQNVSHRGIGLISDRPFEPGAFLKIELPSIRRTRLEPKVVRVSHSMLQPSGDTWAVGGVFLRPLEEQELQLLL
jgi:hypothetical protein